MKSQSKVARRKARPTTRSRKTSQNSKSVGANQQLIVVSPHQPLAQSMRTTFDCYAEYKIPVSTASITSGAVKLNSPWLPFRPGGASAFGSYTFQGPNAETTLLPTGWSNLAAANLYQFNKVLRSQIRVRMSTVNSGNNSICTLFPAYNTTSVADVFHARTFPFSKDGVFNASKVNQGCDRDGWLVGSCDPYRYIGTNKPEAKADLFFQDGSFDSDPNVVLWWHVYLQTLDLDVTNTNACAFEVQVRYVVELFGLQQMATT